MSSQNAILEQLLSLSADYELTLDQVLLEASSVSTRLVGFPGFSQHVAIRECIAGNYIN
jgi:hypothetical protein